MSNPYDIRGREWECEISDHSGGAGEESYCFQALQGKILVQGADPVTKEEAKQDLKNFLKANNGRMAE